MKYSQITLIVTEYCNLNCTYCYEKHKQDSKMSFKTAKAIIDQEMQAHMDDDVVQIEFFGGEPFLNFELIRQVVEYVEKTYPGKGRYNSTTNGTVLTDEMKKWLWEHKSHFFLALSSDGTKEMHDRNRTLRNSGKGSYDRIDWDFFRMTYEPAPVKMTISPNNLPYLAEGVEEITKKGFEADATLAMGDIDWTDKRNVDILIKQLNELIIFYRENPEYKPIRMLNVPIDSFYMPAKKNTRYCGAGVNMHCYTGNNMNWTPCQGFSSITLGEEASKQYEHMSFEDYVEPDGICKSCKVTKFCSRCWATNLMATGSIDTIDPWLCVINRVMMLAGVRIQYDRITAKKELTEEDQRQLKVIDYIIENAFNPENQYLMDMD